MIPLLIALLAAPETVETEHYRIVAEGPREQAEEFGRVLEAAFPLFQAHFKKKLKVKKKAPLVVRYYETREAWMKGIEADKATLPEGGAAGYYWPATKTVYFYKQPTAAYTRVLLIHEASHQYHFLAVTKNNEPAAEWYTEGVAEYLSWHHWDGARLTLGQKPAVSLKDYPAAALAEVKADGFDLEKFVKGEIKPSRPLAWALYRFIAHGDGGKPIKRYKDFCKKMNGGVAPAPAFKRLIGKFAEIQPAFVKWLEGEQQDWHQVHVEWQALGPGRFRGSSQVVSVLRLKKPIEKFACTLETPTGKRKRWLGGVLLAYASKDDFTVALLDWGGFLRIHRRLKGKWKPIEQGQGPPADKDGNFRLQIFRRGGKTYLMIGTLSYGPWDVPGESVGLAVDKGTVVFREVSWK